MDILYFGTVCDEEFEKKVLERIKIPSVVAQNNLERALLTGFLNRGINSVTANCIPCMPYEVLGNQFVLKSITSNINDDIKTKTYTVVKLPLIKYIIYFLITFCRIIQWHFKSNDTDKFVYITINFAPVAFPIKVLSKIFKYKTVCMVADLSKDLYCKERVDKLSRYKKVMMPFYHKLANWLESSYDYYVFLAEAMKEVNKYNKPYVVMEGIYNDTLKLEEVASNKQKGKKILLYAGSLVKKYGIEKFLDVFETIEDKSFELDIYGDGECKNMVLAAQDKDKRIKYCGFVKREELFVRLQEATLLLNLRDPSFDYTKYSFPSKMFEYMASGTPILTTKLQGIPDEYYEFLYTVSSYKNEEIKNVIIDVCNKSDEELKDTGKKARKFVLLEKNSDKQAEKIIKLLNGNSLEA